MTSKVRLEFGEAPDRYRKEFMDELLSRLGEYSEERDRPVPNHYSTSNVTTSRTLDADTVTTAELADVVATLIEDMKKRGLLR